MPEDHRITFEENPSADDLRIVEEGYDAFTEAQIGEEGRREIAFFVRDDRGAVVGGVKGMYSNYGWLWVALLWVSEDHRGRGFGTELMKNIEEEAARNGCTNAYLNTFSFQAVDFYRKLDYRVYGELEDFPVGHRVCAMTKKLAEHNAA